MATYNGEVYILEQLRSILPQLKAQDEIIISDDSSTDRTLEIIHSLGDPRIKVFPYQKFRNPIFNFENALKKASGDIIFLADQDDIWAPNKIEVMVPMIRKHDLALCDCSIVDGKGVIIEPSFFNRMKSKTGLIRNLVGRNSYIGCCMGFSRRLLRTALPFPRKIPMHDSWIGLTGELYYDPILVAQPLVLYRRHGANASQTGSVSTNTFSKKLKFRIHTFCALLGRSLRLARFQCSYKTF